MIFDLGERQNLSPFSILHTSMANPFSFANISDDILSRYPERINPLLPTYYRFGIARLPNVNYFCQTASLPSTTLSQVSIPTPFVNIPSPSKISFDELSITFIVDENLTNWLEIHNWMRSCTNVDSYSTFKPENEHRTTANLLILNSVKKPKLNVMFHNLFPVTLSALDFSSTVLDPEPFQATCTFSYSRYDIEVL